MVLLLIIALVAYNGTHAFDEVKMLRNSYSPDRTDLRNLNDAQENNGDGILPVIGRSMQLVASCVCLAGCLGFFYVEEYATETACNLLQKVSVMREQPFEEKKKAQ